MSRRSSPRKRPLSLTRGSADCDPPTPTSTSTLPTTSDVLVTTGAATAASGTPPTGASDTTSTIDAVATTTTTTTSEDGDTGDGTADVEDGAGECGVAIALDGRREATDRPRACARPRATGLWRTRRAFCNWGSAPSSGSPYSYCRPRRCNACIARKVPSVASIGLRSSLRNRVSVPSSPPTRVFRRAQESGLTAFTTSPRVRTHERTRCQEPCSRSRTNSRLRTRLSSPRPAGRLYARRVTAPHQWRGRPTGRGSWRRRRVTRRSW